MALFADADTEAVPMYVDLVSERSNDGGMVRVGLACLLTEGGNFITTQRLVMRLKTAIELRNVLNELIDDENTGRE